MLITSITATEGDTPAVPRTQAVVRPAPEYVKAMAIAADLRAQMPLDKILRKWRTTAAHVDWLRDEMNQGRYGGWQRR